MAKDETKITHAVMVQASKIGARVFKNVRGMFISPFGGHRVMAGLLAEGASDLIGWHTVTVTPEMVGRHIAVFMAIEVKTSAGRVSAEQKNFLAAVQAAGGIHGIARCEFDANRVVNEWFSRFLKKK